MEELKHCPFCGGRATSSKETTDKDNKFIMSWIGCQKCQVFITFLNTVRGWAQAVSAWNRRAKPENQADLSEEEPLCTENENFIQNKFGYCFYSLGPCPLIYNLYVHPQYRRKGNSRKLLMLVISEIRRSGYDGKIFVEARPKENSIGQADFEKYYMRMGLTIYDACKPEGSEKK